MIPYAQAFLWWQAFILLLPRPVIAYIGTTAIVAVAYHTLKALSGLVD